MCLDFTEFVVVVGENASGQNGGNVTAKMDRNARVVLRFASRLSLLARVTRMGHSCVPPPIRFIPSLR